MAKVKLKKNAPAPASSVSDIKKPHYLLITLILISTLVIYWPSLKNELTNWDDQEYITYNKDLSDASIKKHFTDKPHVMGNYHPLSMLTLAWDYSSAYDEKTGTIDPVPFHRTNLILHVLNALLVYLLVFRLTQNNIVAAITSALFAFHPMHVESVAWASERKDVLYSFFYLAALLSWTYFIRGSQKIIFYLLTLLLFILGLFSKAVMVSLPIALFLLDWFMKRKFDWKVIAEKIPLLAISVYFGLQAIDAQREFEAIDGNSVYSLLDRISFAFYGIMQYIVKFFAPLDLSCFYSFPTPGVDKPLGYLIARVFVIALGIAAFLLRKKRNMVFGSVFFLITVGLVLQLLPVGGAVMADRYSYLPHIGIAFILATYIGDLLTKNGSSKALILALPIALIGIMGYLAFERTKVWKDSITLWTDAESKDKGSPKIYNNFGDAYTLAKQYEPGLKYLTESIRLKPDYPDAYYNRGLTYFYMNKYQEAIDDYTMAIKFKPTLNRAWHNRAGTLYTVGKYKEALSDALKSKELGYPVDPAFITELQSKVGTNK